MRPRFNLLVVGLIILATLASACNQITPARPQVTISTPISTAQFYDGQTISIQSTATDPAGIARVDLLVDGSVVHSDSAPSPVTTFTVVQMWQAKAGPHTLSVLAYNTQNVSSDPALVSLAVLAAAAPAAAPTVVMTQAPEPSTTPTATAMLPSLTPLPSGACTDNAEFEADITVPDKTVVEPGQSFVKTWRVHNIGTCAWNPSYLLTFVGGESMSTTTAFPVPNTSSGALINLSINMVAPSTPGTHTGLWRLENPNGLHFGVLLTVVIRVSGGPAPAPTLAPATPTPGSAACSGVPVIESFSISPFTINAGDSATLNWGFVSNANRAEIDQGIGGVATPGSITVSPASTDTFTLTAFCGSNTATAQVTLTVNPSASPTPPPTATPTPSGPPTTVTRCAIGGESGNVVRVGATFTGSSALLAGDNASNNPYRAFLSFDASDLAHKSIDAATLTIAGTGTRGSPMGLEPLFVDAVQYAALNGAAYDAPGTAVLTIPAAPNGTYGIRSSVQLYANAAKPRYQLRFRLASDSNHNNTIDLFTWQNNNVCVTITFR